MGPEATLCKELHEVLVVHAPKLWWASHWLGTIGLQHLRWQEPVHVTDEGSAPVALGALL